MKELLQFVPPEHQNRTRINVKDGSILTEIPAGPFQMGDFEDSDCPWHTVHLDGYLIGVFAVTNRQYQRFVEETGHRAPNGAEWGIPIWRYGRFPEELALHPVVCVGWEDSTAYCRWAGLTLPTEAQWEKAARGSAGYKYPWGNEWNLTHCMNYMNKGGEQTAPFYGCPSGMSDYGLFNCSGNVLEWCRDWYEAGYYAISPLKNPEGPFQGTYRIARGGSWGSGPGDCRCAYRGDYNLPGERANFRGFRVASVFL